MSASMTQKETELVELHQHLEELNLELKEQQDENRELRGRVEGNGRK